MYLEGHDSEVYSEKGSLVSSILAEEYDVDDFLDVLLAQAPSGVIQRVFGYWRGTAHVVWAINRIEGIVVVQYVGRHHRYHSGAKVGDLSLHGTNVVTFVLGQDGVNSVVEAQERARRTLRSVWGTVVLLDGVGVLRAWERGPKGVALTANGVRPRPRLAGWQKYSAL